MSKYITIAQDLPLAAQFIAQGRIVAMPTGTSYGLAVDTQQGWALQRLRNLKGRAPEKPFSVCLTADLWPTYLALSNAHHRALMALDNLAVTVLVRPADALAHLAHEGHVAVRSIDHPLMRALVQAAHVPLTATSANRSGHEPAYTPAQILAAFPNPLPDDRLDEEQPRGAHATTYDLSLAMVLDGGSLAVHPPSTIIQLTKTGFDVIRPGAITADQIQQLLAS